MYLKDLTLFQFKNHAESNFTFNEKINCFVGNNGVGKTNILDAIHYLSFTKSYFNYMDSQNIQFNNAFFMIRGSFIKDENNDEIQCNFTIYHTLACSRLRAGDLLGLGRWLDL